VSPRVPGDNILHASQGRGPLTQTGPGRTDIAWEGDARLLSLENFTAGRLVDFNFTSLDVEFGGGTLSLRDLDVAIVCTARAPLRITGRFQLASPITGDRPFQVRILDALVGTETPGGGRGLTGRVSVEASDGSRLELDWRDGDGSSYRVSVENGDLGGELLLPTEPLRQRIENSVYVGDEC